MFFSTVLLSSLAGFAAASAPYQIKESVQIPRGWSESGTAPEAMLNLRLGLKQDNLDALRQRFEQISDPEHPDYQRHFAKHELRSLTKPSRQTVSAVSDWLDSVGLQGRYTLDHDWIRLSIPVSAAQRLLQNQFKVYRHKEGKEVIRSTSYSLPIDVFRHIDTIQPITYFGGLQAHKSHVAIMESLGYAQNTSLYNNTPTSIRSLYSVGNYSARSNKSSIAIASYLNQSAIFSDYDLFISKYAPAQNESLKNPPFQVVTINNGSNPQNISVLDGGLNDISEANLDVQYAFSLAYPMNTTVFVTGGMPPFTPDNQTLTDTNEPYLEFLDYALNATTLPVTLSTSYGDDEDTVPEAYARRVCDGFMMLGARGVSVIFSSGDNGVGGSAKNATTCSQNGTIAFLPSFPASCPYVTSVGSTIGDAPEQATTRFASGGGFSNYFARPDYQNSSIEAYMPNVNKTYAANGLVNLTGRGIPDVSAQGDHFQIILNGTLHSIGGTSASAPTFAGIIALVNDMLLAEGKAPLGFLNPFLYGRGLAGLKDIVNGTNPGCGTQGFNATKGWDPVTGLGTPNFTMLASLALNHTVALNQSYPLNNTLEV